MRSAQQMAAKWKAAMASGVASQNYKDGINAYNGNPMAEAATPEAMAKYQNRVNESITSGKRQRKLLAANPATWKQNAVTVGAAALASGATKAASKVEAHFQRFGPAYQQASDAAKAIPHDGSTESALARVRAAIQVMKDAARS
jgi:hypothetical protein